MKRRNLISGLWILVFLLCNSYHGQAQSNIDSISYAIEPKKTKTHNHFQEHWYDKFRFGGNFSGQLGTTMFIDFSPMVTYTGFERFYPGLGASYMYSRIRYVNHSGKISTSSTSVFGGRVLSRYKITNEFLLHGEYENLNCVYYNDDGTLARKWVPALMAGGVYFVPVGNRGGFTITALYNLLWNANKQWSPYPSAFIYRVGFMF